MNAVLNEAPPKAPGRSLATVTSALPALRMGEDELVKVLQSSMYPGAQMESIKMVLGYCKASELDPMQKPVHIVPMQVKSGKKNEYGDDVYENRDVVMPGIGLYRTQAARTGQLAGISEPVFGPEKALVYRKQEWVDGDNGKRVKRQVEKTLQYPEWCKVTVRRALPNGSIAEFTACEYWTENYATAGKGTTAPNAMWERRVRGQIAKCAEAQALRKGFPEAVGAQPTAEEMEGKSFDDIDTIDMPVRQPVAMPQAKPAVAPETTPTVVDAAPATGTAPAVVPAATTNAPVGPGKMNYLKNKAAALQIDLAEFAKGNGISDLEHLTEDGFLILKAELIARE